MPRGRHRHSPPLHRMLPPSAIAGVSLVCALGPWVFTQPMTLRLLAAAAAVTAIIGAVVMRHWDILAGKQVADLTRARAGDEWRFEERVAELEADLEESRELRVKLEQRLRAKRAELAGLRNEHAALLRRYAAAETERASVLEERRVLEIEAAVPARALPAGPSARSGDETARTASVPAARSEDGTAGGAAVEEVVGAEAAGAEPTVPSVFSPEGSKLFLRAEAALARFGDDAPEEHHDTPEGDASESDASEDDFPQGDGPGPARRRKPGQPQRDGTEGQPGAVGEHERVASSDPGTDTDTGTAPEEPSQPEQSAPPVPPGRSVRPSGHFTVPTAVAVVPPTEPVRRPVTDGGFDFFGTQKDEEPGREGVQNEDLADVVGQEVLALHRTEDGAGFEPAGEDARAVGQVIDLTAHDEPEGAGPDGTDGPADPGGTADAAGAEGLRSAVS
ncbi:hypothetical protein [Streptomyces sp. M2CJ-2]|uniref:hypothetical protein n=1 Tax=Streptomyces sp. M2CJ-2 TaxID=2803948 RepID=UPI001F282A60|nr:hypothetical protein [Streptomyces sp. M2CJ-2]